MEQEKEELNKKLDNMANEYNELVDRYNKFIDIKPNWNERTEKRLMK